LMSRPPRPATDSPFANGPLGHAVLQGMGVALVLLIGQAWLLGQGSSAQHARSVVFGVLVLSVLLLILANRDLTRPVFLGKAGPNPWLNRMVAAMVVTLVAVMGIPWLQQVMGTVWPGGTGFAAGAVLFGLCGLWLELLRRVGRSLAHIDGRPS